MTPAVASRLARRSFTHDLRRGLSDGVATATQESFRIKFVVRFMLRII
ncbi:hypothetical protein RMSM_00490 [Rhodopirellula maiorica SM1]|uniref:Uncharacterized protein n=2 Tax=Novipirellula TaxID=2795426 RepID=M5S4L1_9BACT|nr:hypothetical protein RMSM_00490 [Rhodopirellula maiorica SM1]